MTIGMVKKVISKLKFGKAAGPSGVVVEMVRAAGDTGANMICNLAIAIIRDEKVPADWEESFIIPSAYRVYRGYIVFAFSVRMLVCVCVCVC